MKIAPAYKGCKLYNVGQKFGVNPCSYQPNGHTGIDIIGDYGVWLTAPELCEVVRIITDLNFNKDLSPLENGYGILLRSKINPNTTFLHWHCNPVFPVKEGDVVAQGQPVAQMGNSGFVFYAGVYVPINMRTVSPHYGTHDHFEVRIDGQYVDPLPFIDWNIQIKYDLLTSAQEIINKIKGIILK